MQAFDSDNSMLLDKFSLSSTLKILFEMLTTGRSLLNESIQCLFLCPSSVMKKCSPILKPLSALLLSSTCTYICSLAITGKARLYFLLTRRIERAMAKQVSKRKQ